MIIRQLIEFTVVLIILITSGFVYDPSIFEQDLGVWMILIGVGWFIGTFVTACFSPIKQSIQTAALCIFIAFTGAFITSWTPPVPPTADEMGNHPQAEWQIRLSYKRYGLTSWEYYTFTGPTYEADIAVEVVRERWDKENPNNKALSVHKILTYIPKEHAEQNNYPEIYTKRY